MTLILGKQSFKEFLLNSSRKGSVIPQLNKIDSNDGVVSTDTKRWAASLSRATTEVLNQTALELEVPSVPTQETEARRQRIRWGLVSNKPESQSVIS